MDLGSPLWGLIFSAFVLGITWRGALNTEVSLLRRLPVIILALAACFGIVIALTQWIGGKPLW